MARCLIVGCGCRGQALARALLADGHVVRGTTRNPATVGQIEGAGAEAIIADPDRVATLVPALDHVSVAVILLGTAHGEPETVEALHTSRLEMLLTKMLDTTIRGIVYEVPLSVDPATATAGAGLVRTMCETSRIPHALIERDPTDHVGWLAEATAAVTAALGG
jgi:uncharacterized protein YbjT (DUF2867 family)